jgi:hypothetical protein
LHSDAAALAPNPTRATAMLALQRSAGNRAVMAMVQRMTPPVVQRDQDVRLPPSRHGHFEISTRRGLIEPAGGGTAGVLIPDASRLRRSSANAGFVTPGSRRRRPRAPQRDSVRPPSTVPDSLACRHTGADFA